MTTHASGAPFRSEELGSAEVLASVGPYTACADDPPGTPISPTLPPASRVVIELETVTRDVRATTVAGVRRLADADRRIGAACATVANSRFEEGTEHLWSYSYEHAIGAHPVHGETASFAVCALAHARGNEPERSLDIVSAAGTRADRIDLESEGADVPRLRHRLGRVLARGGCRCSGRRRPPDLERRCDARTGARRTTRTDRRWLRWRGSSSTA
jgi:hypothetical protein